MSRQLAAAVAAAFTSVTLWASPAPPPAPPDLLVQSDLDVFMGKVLARRDENWKKLQQYILEEREVVEIRGSSQTPVWGERRDYSWFLRDGYFVRSPIKVNGITIADADRRKYEESYLRRIKARERRQKDGGRGGAAETPASTDNGQRRDAEGLILQTRQPDFIDSAYFLRFKFEQGKYALVGREQIDGRDVLRIEYYPDRLFSDDQERNERRQRDGKPPNQGQQYGATLERMMNKVSLVTLWVEPTASQIVKYTFDNVNFDFLPVAWLVRIQDAKATMMMGQPFKDVWLPASVDMFVSAMTALGTMDIRYHLEYHDYKEATTSARIKAPAGR